MGTNERIDSNGFNVRERKQRGRVSRGVDRGCSGLPLSRPAEPRMRKENSLDLGEDIEQSLSEVKSKTQIHKTEPEAPAMT